MDFSKIEEVLDTDKKTSASRAKKEKYVELMVAVLNDQGFTNKSVEYLRRGFGFAGAKPIIQYLSGMDRSLAAPKIDQLFKCSLTKNTDRVAGFRLCTSLMGYALEEFDVDRKILKECIMLMPNTSKKKNGELLGEAPKTVENNLLNFVSGETELPDLNALGLKDIFLNEFKTMMQEILEKVQNIPSNQVEKFMLWLDPTRALKTSENTEKAAAGLQPVEPVINNENPDLIKKNGEEIKSTEKEAFTAVHTQGKEDDNCYRGRANAASLDTVEAERKDIVQDTPAVTPSVSEDDMSPKDKKLKTIQKKTTAKNILSIKNTITNDCSEMAQASTLMFSLAERMTEWARINEDMVSQNGQLMSDNSEQSKKIEQLQIDLHSEKEKNHDLKAELDEDATTIADLKTQLGETKRNNTELQAQIISTQEEIVRLNSILSVYTADKENSQTEQLNAIASKLRSEYRDFKDAETEEMSIDLGENFRFQLQQIFKILAKAGIDVEKR